MPRDPVLRWAALAREAGRRYGIPPAVLLGVIAVESGGREGRTSSAAAGGLTQFIPQTAAAYDVDVRPGHARSQIMGAARYLRDLGYHTDPQLALASYNAGPGNPQAAGDYPQKVMRAARRYQGLGATGSASSSAPGPAAPGADDEALPRGQRSPAAQRWLLTIGLVLAGASLVIQGAMRMLGIRWGPLLRGATA